MLDFALELEIAWTFNFGKKVTFTQGGDDLNKTYTNLT